MHHFMSKSYRYFANKRQSHKYFEAITGCKNKQSHNFIRCNTCLRPAGSTRNFIGCQPKFMIFKNQIYPA